MKKVKYSKEGLKFFIQVLSGKKVGPDTYDYYYRKFKNGIEICLAVQMVMFKRSLETSIDMIVKEREYINALNNFGTMSLERGLTIN